MSELINALQNPKLYSHQVTNFKVIETHISWVILTGTYAYKIKKAVDFGFLDFTTLAKRQYFCELELTLNQKLSSDLYLKVIPITGTLTNPQLNGEGEIIEYALMMREFAQEDLLTQKEVTYEQIQDLAQIMADFHTQTAKVTNEQFLSVQTALNPVEQNFSQIRPLLNDPQDLANLAQLEQTINSQYSQLKQALSTRIKIGAIRECHGDVHLGNIVQNGEKPLIFDCIEFNDEFRLIDVISDIAFLIMDLADRGQQDLSNILRSIYLEQTGDYEGLSVLNFYLTHRALVRAKVNLLSLAHADANKVMHNYRNYLNLAAFYQQQQPQFIAITYGISGSGKSLVAQKVVANLGAIALSSDTLRTQKNSKDYSTKGRDEIYQELFKTAKVILQHGFAPIIDATFLNSEHRKQALNLAQKFNVPFLIVNCKASEADIKQRLSLRRKQPSNNSDATFAIVKQQLSTLDVLSKFEQKFTLQADDNFDHNLKTWWQNLAHNYKTK